MSFPPIGMHNRIAPAFVIGLLVLIGSAASVSGYRDNRDRIAQVADPTLHMAQIEKERDRPEPGPRPRVDGVPGQQTFILHPYLVKRDLVTRLAILRVPDKFFTRHRGPEPQDVFALNLVVQYPEMTNEFPPGRCGDRCGDQIWIDLEAYEDGRQSKAARQADMVYEAMTREARKSEPSLLFSGIEKGNYDESYRQIRPSGAGEIQYFIKKIEENVVECALIRMGIMNPSVDIFFALPSHPNIQVEIGFSKDYWDNRIEIRNAAIRLIETFYDRDISSMKD